MGAHRPVFGKLAFAVNISVLVICILLGGYDSNGLKVFISVMKGWAEQTISSSLFYREIFKRGTIFSPLNWRVFPAVTYEWVVWILYLNQQL